MTSRLRTKFFLWIALAALCLWPAAVAAQAPEANVGGKWHFVFQTEGGVREFDATFQQDGDKITGKWANTDEVKGTFSGGKLALEFPVNSEEAGPGTLKLDGNLADDVLKGDWSFQSYNGTFKATRPKPATS